MEQIPKVIHESWHKYLEPLFQDDRMKFIKYEILTRDKFLPSPENIFRVFSMPLEDIKLVILGQDPYAKPGVATGHAFAVKYGTPIPYSLHAIRQEALTLPLNILTHGEWGTLKHWSEQGVFLLNSALTVQEYNSGRHLKVWRWFTEEVIKIISYEITPIWFLWGKKAQSFEKTIVDSERFLFNDILKAPHPASSAYGNTDGFLGCNHFKIANEILVKKQQKIINF
jgi:uracil-DNA glycosylase